MSPRLGRGGGSREAAHRFVRHLSTVLALAAATVFPAAASAAPDDAAPATVTVSVKDSRSLEPLRAVVVIAGPVHLAESTETDGAASISALPPGDYVVTISRRDYATVTQKFHVGVDGVAGLDVRLVRTGLRSIGTVAVRRRGRPDQATAVSSVQRLLSASVERSMETLPGVAFADDRQPGATRTISLEGRDPTRTAVTLNGVPLNVPGAAADLRGLDFDLFDATSVRYAETPGAAGTVGLQTLQPTGVWQTTVDGSYGTFARSLVEGSVQGTAGPVGIAYKHADRHEPSPLDGDTFLDASGDSYRHAADSRRSGDALVLSTHGAQSVTVNHLGSTERSDAACALWINALPCGYGPGNSVTTTFAFDSVADAFSVGAVAVSLSRFRSVTASGADFRQLRVAGDPAPSYATTTQSTDGSLLSISSSAGRHQFELDVSRVHRAADASQFATGGVESASSNAAGVTYATSDRIRLGERVVATAAFQGTSIGTAAGSVGSLGFVSSSAKSTYGVVATGGTAVSLANAGTLVTAPSTLFLDCPAGAAFGTAPSAPSARSALSGVRAFAEHDGTYGTLSVQAYAESQRGTSYPAFVNAADLPAGTLPAGYLAAARAYAASAGGCGVGAAPRVYLSTDLSGVNLAFRGAHVAWRTNAMPRVATSIALDITSATARSSDALSMLPTTLFQNGAQLRGVPLVSGSASAAYTPRAPGVPELYLGVRYAGWNNASALPPHARFDLAVREQLRRGELALVVNNVLNQYSGTFAGAAFAQPYVLASGAALPALAVPETPRSVSLRYTAAIGRNARTRNALSAQFGASAATDVLVPGTLLRRWTSPAARDAFERNTGAACTARQSGIADDVLSTIKRFVSGGGLAGGQTPSAPDGVAFARADTATAPVLAVRTTRVSVTQAIFACGSIVIGSPDDAAKARLPYPPALSLTSVTLYYTPSKGLYFVQYPASKNLSQKFRTYALPSSPPKEPFALEAGLCVGELRPVADALLGDLSAHFGPSHAPARLWTVIEHAGSARAWYELRSDEIGTATAMLNCAHVASASTSELGTAALTGAPPPAFDYSPVVGLFIVSGR